MSNAKIENLFNLALDASAQEREKSLNLGVGYSREERTWEVIVRFARDGIEQARALLDAYWGGQRPGSVTVLSGSYAILILPESLVDEVANLNGIIYMEKPKRLFFAVNSAKRASCISALQSDGNLGNAVDWERMPCGGD